MVMWPVLQAVCHSSPPVQRTLTMWRTCQAASDMRSPSRSLVTPQKPSKTPTSRDCSKLFDRTRWSHLYSGMSPEMYVLRTTSNVPRDYVMWAKWFLVLTIQDWYSIHISLLHSPGGAIVAIYFAHDKWWTTGPPYVVCNVFCDFANYCHWRHEWGHTCVLTFLAVCNYFITEIILSNGYVDIFKVMLLIAGWIRWNLICPIYVTFVFKCSSFVGFYFFWKRNQLCMCWRMYMDM